MFTEVMNESLEANKKLVNNLSGHKLEKLMSEFDDYEIDYFSDSFSEKSFSEYLHEIYKKYKYKLFEEFDVQNRKSVILDQKILTKNPDKVLFLF